MYSSEKRLSRGFKMENRSFNLFYSHVSKLFIVLKCHIQNLLQKVTRTKYFTKSNKDKIFYKK